MSSPAPHSVHGSYCLPRVSSVFLASLGVFVVAVPAQQRQVPIRVPIVTSAPTGTTFDRSVDDEYAIAAQTDAAMPGVMFRVQDSKTGAWSPLRQFVVDSRSGGREPTVVIEEEDVFLCWVERMQVNGPVCDNLYFVRSEDGGDTFSSPLPMQPPTPDSTVVSLDAAWSRSVLTTVVQWRPASSSTDQLVVQRSVDGGVTFVAAPTVAGVLQSPGERFGFATSEGSSGVAWVDARTSRLLVRTWGSTAPAAGAPLTVESLAQPAQTPALDIGADTIALAWTDAFGGVRGVVAAMSTSAFGASVPLDAFAPGAAVVEDLGVAVDPTSAGDRAVAVWTDDHTGLRYAYAASFTPTGVAAESKVFSSPVESLGCARSDRQHAPGWFVTATESASGERVGTSSADGRRWLTPIGLGVRGLQGAGPAIQPASIGFDPGHNLVTEAWLVTEAAGTSAVLAGGMRLPNVFVEDPQAGDDLAFTLEGFPRRPLGQEMPFRIVLSRSFGELPLPTGDILGLSVDRFMLASLGMPQLLGLLDTNGDGESVSIPLPASAAGFSFTYAAVAWSAEGDLVVTPPARATIQ